MDIECAVTRLCEWLVNSYDKAASIRGVIRASACSRHHMLHMTEFTPLIGLELCRSICSFGLSVFAIYTCSSLSHAHGTFIARFLQAYSSAILQLQLWKSADELFQTYIDRSVQLTNIHIRVAFCSLSSCNYEIHLKILQPPSRVTNRTYLLGVSYLYHSIPTINF